jgi:acyl-CoA reductase-like NAD-dependent aldehyde dehydrogenase
MNTLARLLFPLLYVLSGAAAAAAPVGPFDNSRNEATAGEALAPWLRDRGTGWCLLGLVERRYLREDELLTGGVEPPEGVTSGFYVRPTIFGRVTPEMAMAREEIFGPVLCIMTYNDEEDAIRIANGTQYGLAAAVWSGDTERAERIARRLRAGQVDINGGDFNLLAPFGGCKQSGYGRELGRHGLEEFLTLKSLQFKS